MPRYFFHTLDGRCLRDREGEILADPATAEREALRIMGEILRDSSAGFPEASEFSVLCTDGQGDVVAGFTARRNSARGAAALLVRVNDADPQR